MEKYGQQVTEKKIKQEKHKKTLQNWKEQEK